MFTVTELPHLTALFRAMLEAKFHSNPEDEDLAASSLLAEVVLKLRDCLIAAEREQDGISAEQRWKEWLAITPARREWRVSVAYAARNWKDCWSSWAPDVKERAVRQLLSPFDVSDTTIAEFSDELTQTLGHA